jgi:GT2 family glycosyltransferase
MTTPFTYSAVLITKDRPARAEAMLYQMTAQSRRPVRMVIVDASNPPLELDEERVASARDAGIDLVVIHVAPSMTAQRNRGVDLVQTQVTLMLDDDVVLDAHYMERLLERWAARGLDALGGAVGANRPGGHDLRRFSPAERLIRRLFFLHDIAPRGRTTLRRSGKVRQVLEPREDVLVPVFGNGAVAYRTDLLRKYRFDEQFTGYVYGEDLDVSIRLARDAPILHTPSTWYIHEWAPEGRANDAMWYRRSRQEAYFRLRLINRSPLSLAAFALSVVAETMLAARQAARARSIGPLRSYLRGLAGTLRAVHAESRRGG